MKKTSGWRSLGIAGLAAMLAGGCGAEPGGSGEGTIRGAVPRAPVSREIAAAVPVRVERPAPVFAGKVDPFEPLYREREGGAPSAGAAEVDLDRFRLTALVRSPGGTVALLWEDGGRSHVVRTGADLGRNIVVAEVGPDRLVLRATGTDAFGDPIARERELRLPDRAG